MLKAARSKGLDSFKIDGAGLKREVALVLRSNCTIVKGLGEGSSIPPRQVLNCGNLSKSVCLVTGSTVDASI